jgi:hypothetical protein
VGEVKIRIAPGSIEDWFIVGLEAGALYDVEVDLEEMTDATTDRGGILPLSFTRTENQLVRVQKRPASTVRK